MSVAANVGWSGPSEESRFLAHAVAGRNGCLTGPAGTGKTTLLKQFVGTSPRRVDITAPTGVAALNAGGMTLHRFCGMLLGPQAGQSNEDYFATLERDGRRSVLAGFNRVRRCESLAACRTYVCVLNSTLYDSIWRTLIFGEGVLMVQNRPNWRKTA